MCDRYSSSVFLLHAAANLLTRNLSSPSCRRLCRISKRHIERRIRRRKLPVSTPPEDLRVKRVNNPDKDSRFGNTPLSWLHNGPCEYKPTRPGAVDYSSLQQSSKICSLRHRQGAPTRVERSMFLQVKSSTCVPPLVFVSTLPRTHKVKLRHSEAGGMRTMIAHV